MTISRATLTVKHGAKTMKKLFKTLSSSPPDARIPPPETEIPPPETEIPPLETEIPPPETEIPPPEAEIPLPEATHAFGILGVVGPLSQTNGWMVTDFGAWLFLISNMRGYSAERSTWRTIRPINHLFADNFVTFGDAGCDRLRLPLPSPLKTSFDGEPEIEAEHFASLCLFLLQEKAREVKKNETFVVLLVGHGDDSNQKFRFLITTQPHQRTGEAVLTKNQLEHALKGCQGKVLIVCNSCFSGRLASEHWTLLCSAAPGEMADALTESGSGHVRGSAFTACLVAQAAHEHGLDVPVPRAKPRTAVQVDPLPRSAPPHSFPLQVARVSLLQPSKMTLEELVWRMQDTERYFVVDATNIFHTTGPQLVKPDSEDFVSRYNGMCVGMQGGPSPTLESHIPRFDPLLMKLATAMPDFGHVPFAREAVYSRICADFRRHIADPQQYPSPFGTDKIGEENLLLVLRALHVQAIAIQVTARVLGWWKGDMLVAFLPWKFTTWNFDKMIENGIRINELPWHLKTRHFPELSPVMDYNSAQWLADQWAHAGRHKMKPLQWGKLMETVGVMTEEMIWR